MQTQDMYEVVAQEAPVVGPKPTGTYCYDSIGVQYATYCCSAKWIYAFWGNAPTAAEQQTIREQNFPTFCIVGRNQRADTKLTNALKAAGLRCVGAFPNRYNDPVGPCELWATAHYVPEEQK
jgi:hypothetical protein